MFRIVLMVSTFVNQYDKGPTNAFFGGPAHMHPLIAAPRVQLCTTFVILLIYLFFAHRISSVVRTTFDPHSRGSKFNPQQPHHRTDVPKCRVPPPHGDLGIFRPSVRAYTVRWIASGDCFLISRGGIDHGSF